MNFSIIIPCFNERENVVTLTHRIQKALENTDYSNQYDIWFIDDSTDHTPDLLEQLSAQYQNVYYKHRTTSRGLGSAVVEGFQLSNATCLIVMDSDLQHPPEVLPVLMRALENNDVVIPSRFVANGSDGGLNTHRKLVSLVARKIGQFALKRFRPITDCTSGFFGLHRAVIQNVTLNPISWKILMEILVKGQYQTITEIPYEFMARDLGDSKMSAKEQWRYLKHIVKLIALSPDDRRFYLWCLGGLLVVILFFIFW